MIWGDVKSAVAVFLHRKDADMNQLQALALSNINLALKVQDNEAVANLPLSGDPRAIGTLPADYGAMRACLVDGYDLDPVDMREMLVGPSKRGYAVSGGKLYVWPSSSMADLVYSARAPVLMGDDDTNWLSDLYPDILCYGMAKHGAIIKEDQEMIDRFENQFLSAVTTANGLYLDAAYGAGWTPQIVGGRV